VPEVIGLDVDAASIEAVRSVGDFARDAVDRVAIRCHTFTTDLWETPAPKIWPPPLTYSQARSVSRDVLTDSMFRRVPHFRYGLVWTRPAD